MSQAAKVTWSMNSDDGRLVQWEWLTDCNEWKRYNPEDNHILEKTYRDGEPLVSTKALSFNTVGSLYFLDFEAMSQMNADSGTVRQIRRMVVQWEWFTDGNEWKAYHPEDNHLLDKAFGDGESLIWTKALGFNKNIGSLYFLDFDAMSQMNADSGTVRKIRRSQTREHGLVDGRFLSQPARWEWLTDCNEWKAYNSEDNHLLEKAYGEGTLLRTKALSFNKNFGSLYFFDFDAMSQLNADSGTMRKIRRAEVRKLAKCIK